MDLKYKNEMEKNNLSFSELPEDAQIGIDQINQVLKAFNMLEKRGKKPTAKALQKLKAMDKWVCYEILDYLHDSDENEDDIPFEAEDVLEDINKQKNNKEEAKEEVEEEKVDPVGLKVESELEELYKTGVFDYTIEDIEQKAPKTYDVLFDSYEENADNGVVTTKYSLLETSNDNFKLKLN
jgi:hypothetical protein